MRAGKQQGFSLVEVIVAVTITAVLAGAVYTTFAQGTRLWSRGSKDRSEWKTRLFVEKFTSELRNAFMDPQWGFQGKKDGLAFASLSGRDPVYVGYQYDPKSKTLISLQKSFKEAVTSKVDRQLFRAALDKVRSFGLEYYAYDPTAKGYRWFPAWNRNCFPETVKVTIELDGGENQKMMSMIDLPVRVACPS
jgi:general secretion pathway protein J